MKKTLKKLTAVLLVTLLISVSVPLHSFAAIKIPVIEKIEISEGSQAVSLKELDSYYTLLFEGFEGNGTLSDMESIKEKYPDIYEHLLRFYLSSSNFDYTFEVTLSSGKVYTLSADDSFIEVNKLYSLEIDAFITYESYLSAKESGAEVIEAEVSGCFYNNINYNYCEATSYVVKKNLPLIDMVVKSITPVSGISEKYYCDQTYIDIEGAEFLIEYADGRTVTATAEAASENKSAYDAYRLDGDYIYAYCDFYGFLPPETVEDGEEVYCKFYFEYLDAYCETSALYVDESMLESIKITDCVFDAENAYLSSLTYELTFGDGRTESFTSEFTEAENPLLSLMKRINAVDGYTVILYCSLGDIEEYGEKINADSYYFTVNAGEVTDTFKADNPYKDVMNGPLNVAYFFINLFSKIQNFFYSIFDLIFFGF